MYRDLTNWTHGKKFSAQKCLRSTFSFKANVIWTSIMRLLCTDEGQEKDFVLAAVMCSGRQGSCQTSYVLEKSGYQAEFHQSEQVLGWASPGHSLAVRPKCFLSAFPEWRVCFFISGWVPISALVNLKWHKAKCQIKLECFTALQSNVLNNKLQLNILIPSQHPRPNSVSSSPSQQAQYPHPSAPTAITTPAGSWKLLRAACSFVLFSGLGRWHFCSVIHSLAYAFIWADILIMQIRISLMKKKINFTTVATNTVTVLLMSLHS